MHLVIEEYKFMIDLIVIASRLHLLGRNCVIWTLTRLPFARQKDGSMAGIINNRGRSRKQEENVLKGGNKNRAGDIGFRSFGRLDLFRGSDRAEITSLTAAAVLADRQCTSSARKLSHLSHL